MEEKSELHTKCIMLGCVGLCWVVLGWIGLWDLIRKMANTSSTRRLSLTLEVRLQCPYTTFLVVLLTALSYTWFGQHRLLAVPTPKYTHVFDWTIIEGSVNSQS